MEIKSVKYMLRKNLGNYEYEEITLEGTSEAGEQPELTILRIMTMAKEALAGELGKSAHATETLVEKVELKPLTTEPVATANFVKEKAAPRTRAAKAAVAPKDELENGQAIPPVITEAATSENTSGTSSVVGRVDTANVSHVQSEAPKTSAPVVDKNIVAYDAAVKEHRSRFATFLGTNYPNWKKCRPEEEIRAFSLGLHGKAFEDQKGNMLDTFKSELDVFFAKGK